MDSEKKWVLDLGAGLGLYNDLDQAHNPQMHTVSIEQEALIRERNLIVPRLLDPQDQDLVTNLIRVSLREYRSRVGKDVASVISRQHFEVGDLLAPIRIMKDERLIGSINFASEGPPIACSESMVGARLCSALPVQENHFEEARCYFPATAVLNNSALVGFNVCESLKVGGRFKLVTPNANEVPIESLYHYPQISFNTGLRFFDSKHLLKVTNVSPLSFESELARYCSISSEIQKKLRAGVGRIVMIEMEKVPANEVPDPYL